MHKKQFIAELSPGDSVETLFMLSGAQMNQARNGPYWRLELRDATGSLEAKIWSPLSQQFPDLKPGELIELKGRVVVYRDRNEVAVDGMRILSDAEKNILDLADFLTASPIDAMTMLKELDDLCRDNLKHKPWTRFCRNILKNEEINAKLRMAPAAKAMHHAYAGGLLEHTLGVCRLCMAIAGLYPALDHQLLLAAALCHDLGKIWELSSGLLVDYTTEGRLIGHISIGLEKMQPFLEKSGLEPELAEHFKHLILSHHGQREFGSPCLPSTAEAMALHYADNLDAKLNQISGALNSLPDGEYGWSSYVHGLDRAVFRAMPSPDSPQSAGKGLQPNLETQCSLLLKE